VNEVESGLVIVDTLEGVPLFDFSASAYYRDVIVFCAFIAGLTTVVIFAIWIEARERR